MKLTFLVFTILLLTSLADHHSFRHGRGDDNNSGDRNGDRNYHGDHNGADEYNRGDGSDNQNQNHHGDNSHHRGHSRSDENNQNNGEEEMNTYNEPTDNSNTHSSNTNTDNSTPDNNSNTYYSNANTDSSTPDTGSNMYYSNANTDSSTTDNNSNTAATNTNTGTSSSNSQNGGSSSSSSNSNSGSTDSYAQQCLDSHNQERNSLGLGSVTWNSDLAAASQDWAEHLASVGSLSHSSGRVHVGENVADTTHKSGVDNTVHLIGLWLDEKKYFKNGRYPDISTSGNVHDVGHYSQMIWAATTEIGCATAVGSGHDFMCCQYKRSGNVQGQQVY